VPLPSSMGQFQRAGVERLRRTEQEAHADVCVPAVHCGAARCHSAPALAHENGSGPHGRALRGVRRAAKAARAGAPAEDEEGQPNWGAQARDGQLARDLRGAVADVEDAGAQAIVLRYNAASAPAPTRPREAERRRRPSRCTPWSTGAGHPQTAGRRRRRCCGARACDESRLITHTMLRRPKHGLGAHLRSMYVSVARKNSSGMTPARARLTSVGCHAWVRLTEQRPQYCRAERTDVRLLNELVDINRPSLRPGELALSSCNRRTQRKAATQTACTGAIALYRKGALALPYGHGPPHLRQLKLMRAAAPVTQALPSDVSTSLCTTSCTRACCPNCVRRHTPDRLDSPSRIKP